MPKPNVVTWVNAHPGPAAGVAGGLLGLVVLLRGRAKKSAKNGATPTDSSTFPGYTYGVPLTPASSAGDVIGSVESEIANLAGQLQNLPGPNAVMPTPARLPTPPITTVPWLAPSGETQYGAGYWNPASATDPITDSRGGRYQYVGSPDAVQALVKAGQTVYFQPQPGFFQPWKWGDPGEPASGAPIYAKIS